LVYWCVVFCCDGSVIVVSSFVFPFIGSIFVFVIVGGFSGSVMFSAFSLNALLLVKFTVTVLPSVIVDIGSSRVTLPLVIFGDVLMFSPLNLIRPLLTNIPFIFYLLFF
jgi:hypothetical protein